ncbi:hypothetical protein BPO_2105 [Bergeyella porcorum]|uniref:Outer membrane protein beta-barrel domain-containing protein n=1 Tax=Bergeyella porcorum TaxID=1735111 RepID=A0AAU0F4T7_9FLAO
MKKILLGASILASLSLSAQVDFSSTRFGVLGGYNYSRVQNAHNPSGPRHTFQAGVMALIPVDRNDQFYIQPEVVYYGGGESGRAKDMSAGRPGYNAVYADNYISVPIYFKGYFSEAESEFFGMVGPRFNFLVNQKVTNPSRDVYKIEGVSGINGKAAGFNFGVGIGLGYSYKRKLELTARYDLGISNTYPNMIESSTGDPNTEKKKSTQVMGVGLTYIFD